ncbi:MAG: hypothetical protein GWN64_07840 [Candidatus Thorarchaeota archaeon]|nr:hypothetical protein [Candidatus Thorarchaeota archaeon]
MKLNPKEFKTKAELDSWYRTKLIPWVFGPGFLGGLVGLVYFAIKDNKPGIYSGVAFIVVLLLSGLISYLLTLLAINIKYGK